MPARPTVRSTAAQAALTDRGNGPRPAFSLLDMERDRAERVLNVVRAIVLVLLGAAAMVYAPSLTPQLNRVNVAVLIPTLAWTIAQYSLFHRQSMLPPVLSLVNPMVDVTAVSAIIWGYAVVESPAVALRTPIFVAYFVILASLPVASSTRKATAVATATVVQYLVLLLALVASGTLAVVIDPVDAQTRGAISPLDEGAKLLLLCCAGAVATYAARWQERLAAGYSRASLRGDELTTRLARSELQALKLQLQPHFLFNTLTAITALVHRDAGRAERMVSGLSELLRASLNSAGDQEVLLSRELEVLQHYVDIQQERFLDRLTVSVDATVEARAGLVPSLILQPLVENSIIHGLAPRVAAGSIIISASRVAGRLRLAVRDDGVGERCPEARREGVGLANTRARLQSLYGDDHTFDAGARGPEGFDVEIEIPFRTIERSHSPGTAA